MGRRGVADGVGFNDCGRDVLSASLRRTIRHRVGRDGIDRRVPFPRDPIGTRRTAMTPVWRFRSPHHSCRAFVMRTSEPKPHWTNNLLVSFSIPKFANEGTANDANFGIGTLVRLVISRTTTWHRSVSSDWATWDCPWRRTWPKPATEWQALTFSVRPSRSLRPPEGKPWRRSPRPAT